MTYFGGLRVADVAGLLKLAPEQVIKELSGAMQTRRHAADNIDAVPT